MVSACAETLRNSTPLTPGQPGTRARATAKAGSLIGADLHNIDVRDTHDVARHDARQIAGQFIDTPVDEAPDAHTSLSERAHDEIEHRIATCALAPGEAISEKMLSSTLGIGRTPIREALQRLAREGMVRVLPRRCVRVSTIDTRGQRQLLEVRREIARFVARAAAVQATDAERSALGDVASRMAVAVENHDDLEFMALDAAFDRLIGRATHNVFASTTLGLTSGLLRRLWFAHRASGAQDLEAMRAHRTALAGAIQERDPLAASAASDALLDYLESFTVQEALEARASRRPAACSANDAAHRRNRMSAA